MARPYTWRNPDDVLKAIVEHKRQHDGNSPTLREIAEACGIPSLSVVHRLLKELAGAGRIRLPGATNRGIEVAGGQWALADPEARFPRLDPSCRCDICGRQATWTDGECSCCRIHEPL